MYSPMNFNFPNDTELCILIMINSSNNDILIMMQLKLYQNVKPIFFPNISNDTQVYYKKNLYANDNYHNEP